MSRELAILLTLVVYLIVLVAIGLRSSARTRDGADFFLAGRTMGPIVASISASASSSSAWTLLGVSGFAYSFGLSAVWLFPACVGGFLINWYLLAPRLRALSHATGALTTTEILASVGSTRQRRAISITASVIILSALATYVSSQFQGAGKTLAETFGISPTASILIGSGIVVAYTLAGGFWAVSLTDTLQGLVMAGTSVALPIAAVAAVGPAECIAGLRMVEVDGYASLWRGMSAAGGLGFVAGLLGIGLGYPGQPHVVNRFMALRRGAADLRTARRVAIAWAACVYAGMIVLGLVARVGFSGIDDGEKAFVAVASGVLPPVLAGVMIAAVLSAVMSTADSQLLVAASSVTHDLGVGSATRHGLLARSRVVVVGLSAVAVVGAVSIEQTIFDRVLFAWSAMGCAFGPLLLVTVLRGRVSARGTLLAMLTGFGLSVGAFAAKQLGALGTWSGAAERIVPFVVALAIAWSSVTSSDGR